MPPDLQVFYITLKNTDGPLPIEAVRSHSINGLFYTEMGRRYGEMVDALHENGDDDELPMPFSLAPLHREGYFTGLRVGTLQAEFGQRVAEVWGALAAQEAEVRLGSAQLIVEKVKPPKFPRATSYRDLLADAEIAHGVWLRFETPMRLTIHSNPEVLPLPSAMWEFYAKRWSCYADIELPPNFLTWVEHTVRTKEATLDMRMGYIEGDDTWSGTMGDVSYHTFTNGTGIPKSRVPEYLQAWQALAFLAEFCGTGQKATMGMGRTRRVGTFGPYRGSE